MTSSELRTAIAALENAANYLRDIDDRQDKLFAMGAAVQAAEFAIQQINSTRGRRRAALLEAEYDRIAMMPATP